MMFDSNLNSDFDQTQFGNEGWLFDGNKQMPAIVDPNLPKKIVWWQTTQGKLVLIVVGVIMMFGLLGIGVYLKSKMNLTPTIKPADETEIDTMNLGPLGEKAKALRDQLKLADPTKEIDPFPPIRIDLRLDVATSP